MLCEHFMSAHVTCSYVNDLRVYIYDYVKIIEFSVKSM